MIAPIFRVSVVCSCLEDNILLFFPTATHCQPLIEFMWLFHGDSHCAGHLIVAFTESDFFMAAGSVIYFRMNIQPLRCFGKISLTQTHLKTFISLTCIVLSPFCVNSAHGIVLVLRILTCPNYSMQFLVRTGAIMRNVGILILGEKET